MLVGNYIINKTQSRQIQSIDGFVCNMSKLCLDDEQTQSSDDQHFGLIFRPAVFRNHKNFGD